MRALMIAALLLGFFACGCSTGQDRPESFSTDLQTHLDELAQMPAPDGIAPADWVSLKSALAAQLRQRFPDGRVTAATATGNTSAAVLSFDSGSNTLTWRYSAVGDYDQNGEVNISDLTPLGVNFGETSGTPGSPFPYETAESEVDGDANGEIGITDITPIGANFGNRSSEYRVYASTNAADYPAANGDPSAVAPLTTVLVSNATGVEATDRLQLAHTLASAPAAGDIFWVRPSDGAAEGTPSNMVGPGAPVGEPVVNIFQLDLDYGEGEVYENTTWGQAEVTYTGATEVLYFLLEFNGVEVLTDVPLFSDNGVGAPHTLSIPFNLGNTEGTQVTEAEVFFTLSSAPKGTTSAPRSTSSSHHNVPIFKLPKTVEIDLVDEVGPPPPAPVNLGRPQGQGGAITNSISHGSTFPNQDHDRGEGTAAAVSNSLTYLKSKFSLPIGDGTPRLIDIATMRGAVGQVDDLGAPADWAEKKRDFMKTLGYPIDTFATESAQKAAQAIAMGCDVEIEISGQVSGGGEARIVYALTSIGFAADGTVSMTLLQDGQLGTPGGTNALPLLIPLGGVPTLIIPGLDTVALPDTKAKYIIECPEGVEAIWREQPLVDFAFDPNLMAKADGNVGMSYYHNVNNEQDIRYADILAPFWLADTAVSLTSVNPDREYGPANDMKVINGKPTVAYAEGFPTYRLWCVQATDAAASAWNPATLVSDLLSDGDVSLELVGGFPAIAYQDQSELKFISAQNAEGTAWNTPVHVVYNAGNDIIQLATTPNPTIIYHGFNDEVRRLVSLETTGATWDELDYLTIAPGLTDHAIDAIILSSGNPACVYFTAAGLNYVRGVSDDGQVWSGGGTDIDGVLTETDRVDLALVDGNPAVAFHDTAGAGQLLYHRSQDAEGMNWVGAPEVVSTAIFNNASMRPALVWRPGAAKADIANPGIPYLSYFTYE